MFCKEHFFLVSTSGFKFKSLLKVGRLSNLREPCELHAWAFKWNKLVNAHWTFSWPNLKGLNVTMEWSSCCPLCCEGTTWPHLGMLARQSTHCNGQGQGHSITLRSGVTHSKIFLKRSSPLVWVKSWKDHTKWTFVQLKELLENDLNCCKWLNKDKDIKFKSPLWSIIK